MAVVDSFSPTPGLVIFCAGAGLGLPACSLTLVKFREVEFTRLPLRRRW